MRESASVKVAVVLLLALCAGCSEPAPPDEIAGARPGDVKAGMIWHPERRFVPSAPPTALPPTATIGSETRPALEDVHPVTLNYAPAYPVPADGRTAIIRDVVVEQVAINVEVVHPVESPAYPTRYHGSVVKFHQQLIGHELLRHGRARSVHSSYSEAPVDLDMQVDESGQQQDGQDQDASISVRTSPPDI